MKNSKRRILAAAGLLTFASASMAELPASVATAQAAFQADATTLIAGFFGVVAAVAGLIALLRMFKSSLKSAG